MKIPLFCLIEEVRSFLRGRTHIPNVEANWKSLGVWEIHFQAQKLDEDFSPCTSPLPLREYLLRSLAWKQVRPAYLVWVGEEGETGPWWQQQGLTSVGSQGQEGPHELRDSFCKRPRSIFTLTAFALPTVRLFLVLAPLKVRNRCPVSSPHIQRRSVVFFFLVC